MEINRKDVATVIGTLIAHCSGEERCGDCHVWADKSTGDVWTSNLQQNDPDYVDCGRLIDFDPSATYKEGDDENESIISMWAEWIQEEISNADYDD